MSYNYPYGRHSTYGERYASPAGRGLTAPIVTPHDKSMIRHLTLETGCIYELAERLYFASDRDYDTAYERIVIELARLAT